MQIDRAALKCEGWSWQVTRNPISWQGAVKLTYNALPVDVASGSCPEVWFWSITLLARSLCCVAHVPEAGFSGASRTTSTVRRLLVQVILPPKGLTLREIRTHMAF
jgi:hypothetical protein